MNLTKTRLFLEQLHQPQFRLTQLAKAVVNQKASSWDTITGWSKELQRQASDNLSPFYSYQSYQLYRSSDGTQKAALTLHDGAVIETVLMEPVPHTYSVCVSCEVGCPMNCAFCATGKMGFKRPLADEEISDQWLFWLHPHGGGQPTHLVFMGMGEPFHNRANVFAAISQLHDFYGLGFRKMSVSTSGIPDGIQALAQDFPQVNLAISLHAPTDQLRSQIMPVNQAYNLATLAKAINHYLNVTPRQVMLEYLLLKRVNDSSIVRDQLVSWLKQFPLRLIHVNLIRYNPTGSFESPDKEVVKTWKQKLNQEHISCSIRKNLGTDIMGACGQLANSNLL